MKELGLPPSELCDEGRFPASRSDTSILAGPGCRPREESRGLPLPTRMAKKREKLIDRLLASKEYAEYFANKWSSILRNRRRALTADDAAPTSTAFHMNKGSAIACMRTSHTISSCASADGDGRGDQVAGGHLVPRVERAERHARGRRPAVPRPADRVCSLAIIIRSRSGASRTTGFRRLLLRSIQVTGPAAAQEKGQGALAAPREPAKVTCSNPASPSEEPTQRPDGQARGTWRQDDGDRGQ